MKPEPKPLDQESSSAQESEASLEAILDSIASVCSLGPAKAKQKRKTSLKAGLQAHAGNERSS